MALTRRRVLIIGGAAPIAACTSRRRESPPRPGPVDADTLARRAAAAAELDLAARYEAVVAAHPALTARLAPLVEHHHKHVGALIPTSTSARTGPTPTPSATPRPISPSPVGALRELATGERALAAQHLAALSPASPELALLLASLAAAAAAHEAELSRR